MGFLKDAELEGFKPVRIEKKYGLSKAVGAADVRRLFYAFGDTILPDMVKGAKEVDAQLRSAIQRSFVVTDADGKFSCESLRQLEDHLGRHRVERFVIRFGALFDRRVLIARSDGRQVTVASEAWTRGAALRVFEPTVMTLGLVSPGAGAAPRASSLGARRKAPLKYDAFISHASEDKAAVARPVLNALRRRGYAIWLDTLKMKVGDSPRAKIDDGLSKSRHGIVILSPDFFKKSKYWTIRELDGLFSQEMVVNKRVILPVLHRMSHSQLSRRSPMLAGRIAASTEDGIDATVTELIASMGVPLKRRSVRRKLKPIV